MQKKTQNIEEAPMKRKRHLMIALLAAALAVAVTLWMARSAAQCEPLDLNCMNLP